MKTFLTTIIVFTCFFAIAQNPKVEKNNNEALINFVNEVFNFGDIYAASGHDGLAEFKFVNTGNIPLILTDVKAGCGCTSPFWQKEPVMPGDTGKVVLKYTTIQHPHTINKSAVVYSNAANNPSFVIRITGNVLPKPEEVMPEKNVDKSSMPFAH